LVQIFSSASWSLPPLICVLPLMRGTKFHILKKQWVNLLFYIFLKCIFLDGRQEDTDSELSASKHAASLISF
jgi:hypothetical protein